MSALLGRMFAALGRADEVGPSTANPHVNAGVIVLKSLFLLLLPAAGLFAQDHLSKIHKDLWYAMAEADGVKIDPEFRVIVTLDADDLMAKQEREAAYKTAAGRALIKDMVAQAQDRLLASGPAGRMKPLNFYRTLFGFSAVCDMDAVFSLADSDWVARLELMKSGRGADAEAHPLTNIDLAHSGGFTGLGSTIAIIDDGIDHDNAAFGGIAAYPNAKIVGGYDFADNDNDPTNDCAGQTHGTNMGSIAAADSGGMTGAAPGANLVVLKLEEQSLCGTNNWQGDLVGALDWCVDNQATFNIRVINMSLHWGGTSYTNACDANEPAIRDAVNAAHGAGMSLFAAAGNDGLCQEISLPACLTNVISVGAVSDANIGLWWACTAGTSCVAAFNGTCPDLTQCSRNYFASDLVACFSNAAGILDIWSPGICIEAAVAGSAVLETCAWGTSGATAMASGVGAVVQQASFEDMDTDDMRAVLTSTGVNVTDNRDGVLTRPRIDVGAAIEQVLTLNPVGPRDIHMLVLLDRTGSMGVVRSGSGNTRCNDALQTAIREVNAFFDAHPFAAGNSLSVWTFNGAGFSDLTGGFVNRADALAALNGLDPEGCASLTPMAETLCAAADGLVAAFPNDPQVTRLVSINTDGGENNSDGPCAGPGSVNPAPYDAGSWQRLVRDRFAGQAVVNVKYWTTFASKRGDVAGSLLEGGLTQEAAAKKAVTSQDFFSELADFSGGHFELIEDGGALPSTPLPPLPTPPVAKSKAVLLSLNAGGTASLTPGMVDNGSYDVDGYLVAKTVSRSAFACGDVGRTSVLLTVTDNLGEMDATHAAVTVRDNRDPVLTLNGGSSVVLECGVDSYVELGANASDNCGTRAVGVAGDVVDTGLPAVYTVAYSVADYSGNTDTASRLVTVRDTLAPSLQCPADVTAVSRFLVPLAAAEFQSFLTGSLVTDHCDPAPAVANDAPLVFPLGGTEVVFSAMDESGNGTACAGVVTVELPPIALFAYHSASLEQHSRVTGPVVVQEAQSADWLAWGSELHVGVGAMVEGDAFARKVMMRNKASVTGVLSHNELETQGNTTIGEGVRTGIDLPLPVPAVGSPGVTPGDVNVTLDPRETMQLAAGGYGAVRLKAGSRNTPTTLVLLGGVYHFRSLELGPNSQVVCMAACDLRIQEDLQVRENAYLGPEAGSGIGAADVSVYVKAEGHTGKNQEPGYIGVNAAFTGRLHVPEGRIHLRQKSTTTGRIIGKWVELGNGATLTME